MIGKTLGHYQVVEKIGQGGMGVVYRAQDSNLHRPVALKLLPDAFAADPERLARFEREARLLASLNHPNIAAIHGLEQSEGIRFLVLELVEGQTLAKRIAVRATGRSPMPTDEVLDICRQIAEGLEAAHEKGIVHRDLKPANIKITPEGKVKILDFGLARAFQEEPSSADASQSPTITDQMTRPGVILGTAAYMSPEQAKGKAVDKRADIWAFGCILYECLTNKRAFTGDSITEVVAKILEAEPDWHNLPEHTPAFLRTLLHQCLQKDPRLRLHDIADARISVAESAARDAVRAEAVPGPRRIAHPWLAAGMAVALLTGILLGPTVMRRTFQPASNVPVVRATIKVEPGHWLAGIQRARELQRPSRTAMAISSDGRFIVYSAIEENPGLQAKPRLFLRRMDQSEARPIAGTDGGIHPFLSPDGRWIGFWADGKLKKKPVEGGVATVVCDAPAIYGASWSRDDVIVFADHREDIGLSRISADGGKPEILTKADPKREERSHSLPHWLPNGIAVIFTVMGHGWDRQPRLALLRVDTQECRTLLQDAADAWYVSTGHVVFLRQGTLMAVRFDLARLEIIGTPVALIDNVMQAFSTSATHNTGAGQFSISDTGSLIYAPGGLVPDSKDALLWVDQKGVEQPVTDIRMSFFAPRLSPDGQRIAYYTVEPEVQIWCYDINTGTNNRLTSEGMTSAPTWTPDGKRLIFRMRDPTISDIFWLPYDGSAPMERLTSSESDKYPFSASPDGKTVAFIQRHPGTGWDIAVLDTSSRRVTPFLNSQFDESCPEFSPDGRWMAYASNESKRDEIFVRPFPGPGTKHPVSSEGGFAPLWSKDGRQLFYRSQDQVWAVDVQTAGGFTPGKPRLLFEKSGLAIGGPLGSWDNSLDSQRFLMVKLEQRKPIPVTEMILVQNWFEELKRLVPTGKN